MVIPYFPEINTNFLTIISLLCFLGIFRRVFVFQRSVGAFLTLG